MSNFVTQLQKFSLCLPFSFTTFTFQYYYHLCAKTYQLLSLITASPNVSETTVTLHDNICTCDDWTTLMIRNHMSQTKVVLPQWKREISLTYETRTGLRRTYKQLKMGCTAYTQGGYHKPVQNYPPGCTITVYMYLLGCKERSKVLPKHN